MRSSHNLHFLVHSHSHSPSNLNLGWAKGCRHASIYPAVGISFRFVAVNLILSQSHLHLIRSLPVRRYICLLAIDIPPPPSFLHLDSGRLTVRSGAEKAKRRYSFDQTVSAHHQSPPALRVKEVKSSCCCVSDRLHLKPVPSTTSNPPACPELNLTCITRNVGDLAIEPALSAFWI